MQTSRVVRPSRFRSGGFILVTFFTMFVLSLKAYANTVEVYFLYDNASKHAMGNPSTVLRSWVDTMNGFLDNSSVDLTIKYLGSQAYQVRQMDADALLYALDTNQGGFISKLRQRTGADYIQLITTSLTSPRGKFCGVAMLQGVVSLASPDCGPKTSLHELGHNWGLLHSQVQSDQMGEGRGQSPATPGRKDHMVTRYGFGYGEYGRFNTVMAYPSVFGVGWDGKNALNTFSNPSVMFEGRRTGVAGQADSAGALNKNVSLYVNQMRSKQTSGDNGGGYDLSDNHQYCRRWATQGFCRDRRYLSYMQANCQLSCSDSEGDGSSFLADNVMYRRECPSWAAAGYCHRGRYVNFMMQNCELSCSRL